MYTVSAEEYPKGKQWKEKIYSVPSIPGGRDALLSNLRQLLRAVGNGASGDQVPLLDDTQSSRTLDNLCLHQMSPVGLVRRGEDGKWQLTEESEIWLDSGDDRYLAAFFCSRVKFFAEILYYLDSPRTSRELFNIAVNEYDLSWKMLSTINGRLVWLRQFGMIGFQEFSLLYHITDSGREFLKTVDLVMPEGVAPEEDETASEKEVVIGEKFIRYYQQHKSAGRKAGFGYFPGKTDELCETLADLLSTIGEDGRIGSINDHELRRYGIRQSSVRSALIAVSSLGLIERKTSDAYALTDLGCLWLEEREPLSLLPLFQASRLFVFELLTELQNTCLSAQELAAAARVSYGFDKENTAEISNRLALLKRARLVRNVSAEKLTVTHRGTLFLERYGDIFALGKRREEPAAAVAASAAGIIAELRLASCDSYNPGRFEKKVRDFFGQLGFEAVWLGGPGRTDVLLRTPGLPVDSYTVTVDAKATSAAAVTDGLVDFDTLEEHRKKHGADHTAIVGRGFNDRLISRAKEHGVVLLSTDALEELLNIHRRAPQKLAAYRKVFAQAGEADLSVLEPDVKRAERAGALLTGIMSRLIGECEDPVTKGQLTVRDLYMSLRNDSALPEAPSITDIETALELLASPIIGGVVKEKDFYCAASSLGDLAVTLGFLQEKCCASGGKSSVDRNFSADRLSNGAE